MPIGNYLAPFPGRAGPVLKLWTIVVDDNASSHNFDEKHGEDEGHLTFKSTVFLHTEGERPHRAMHMVLVTFIIGKKEENLVDVMENKYVIK